MLLATRLQRKFDATLPELSLKQWLTLLLLRNLGGDVRSVAHISELSGTTHQNTTKMIALLARDGWVERTRSAGDQRAWQIAVTDRTLDYFQQNEALGDDLLAELFRGIPEADLVATARTLSALGTNLAAMA